MQSARVRFEGEQIYFSSCLSSSWLSELPGCFQSRRCPGTLETSWICRRPVFPWIPGGLEMHWICDDLENFFERVHYQKYFGQNKSVLQK